MKELKFAELNENFAEMIKTDWMLISAGQPGDFNTMTASWGGTGCLWNKDVTFAFIRPQRHTLGFVEREDRYTLSFFGQEQRQALSYCGKVSGKDCDKIAGSGLSPVFVENIPCFEEATMTLVCKKLFVSDMKEEMFLDKTLPELYYKNKDFHRIFIGEIEKVLVK